MDKSQSVNWVEINLAALQNNIPVIQKNNRSPMMAVVKANAYGHGLVPVARAASAVGITWFGVARLEEALVLRSAGVNGHLLVLGYTPPEAAPLAQSQNIQLAVYDREVAQAYSDQFTGNEKKLSVHLKIDSGMGRLGIFPKDGVEFMRWLTSLSGLKVEGAFTHFARADEPNQPTTARQIEQFDAVVQGLQAAGLRPPWIHAANSGATVCFSEARYDLLRPGILMYGLSPSSQVPLPQGISPVLEWKTRLTSIKTLPPGHGVSYGHRYVTPIAETIGAIAVGYADGYRRRDGNVVLVKGHKVPVVGRVCMDQSMIRLENIPDIEIGAEVILLGRQGEECISAEEIAERWDTINYEVLAGLAARVNRIYTG